MSILTANVMAISTLVLALTNAWGSVPAPRPRGKGGVKEWVEKHLQSLGRTLANPAGKAAAAPPGTIGSIVSWLLGTLGNTASWLADTLWALVIGISGWGGLLLVAARDWLSPPLDQPKRH
ncbi:MAG: hypothetical protein N0E58_22345 [Candidatus Thiodiazotropha endolucinida]|uniref:Uncharacterized protein n=1 Tax=Candidatus Thiodiazotropha taylori TaxID=2792791 RepID=A0A9E4NP03_9GAMM|nr:hypothetical protein [Candidatus Thiodiazotropha taylori]MCW4238994.1 hypothetical protein [Candidatus Thiodiazotropha endolucinida]